jgi:hypothetical protein
MMNSGRIDFTAYIDAENGELIVIFGSGEQ